MDCKECFPPHGHICCYLALVLLIVEPSLFSLLRTLVSIILSLWFMDFSHWQHKSTQEKIQQPKRLSPYIDLHWIWQDQLHASFPTGSDLAMSRVDFFFEKSSGLWAELGELQQGPEDCLQLIFEKVYCRPHHTLFFRGQAIKFEGNLGNPATSGKGAMLAFQDRWKECYGSAVIS